MIPTPQLLTNTFLLIFLFLTFPTSSRITTRLYNYEDPGDKVPFCNSFYFEIMKRIFAKGLRPAKSMEETVGITYTFRSNKYLQLWFNCGLLPGEDCLGKTPEEKEFIESLMKLKFNKPYKKEGRNFKRTQDFTCASQKCGSNGKCTKKIHVTTYDKTGKRQWANLTTRTIFEFKGHYKLRDDKMFDTLIWEVDSPLEGRRLGVGGSLGTGQEGNPVYFEVKSAPSGANKSIKLTQLLPHQWIPIFISIAYLVSFR